MNELDEVVFNEVVSDFASLLYEHGASRVVSILCDTFPELSNEVYQQMHLRMSKSAQQIARLFQPPSDSII